MALIKSISGIRGTIGGEQGENLTPLDMVKFVSAYAKFIQNQRKKEKITIVIGRDARISGQLVSNIVCGTLQAMGADVIDLGLSTTPTTEMSVTKMKADGGIILTASHNPMQWNALKLLNYKGEFLNAKEGQKVLNLAKRKNIVYAPIDKIGSYQSYYQSIEDHVAAVLKLKLVDKKAIESADFSVAIDCVNSTGGIAIPMLLKALGVKKIHELYCEPSGIFPHNPEPLPEHLTDLANLVKTVKADVGFTVDPDVDRLAIINCDGTMFGEEYTLVSVSDYVLQNQKGNTVSNMSSTRALRDVTEKSGGSYAASAVGEVNVVALMKKTKAVIGGEGNGGVIYPKLHYGRDALVGIALFLTYLAKTKQTTLQLRASYPQYVISKNKIQLQPEMNVDDILSKMEQKHQHQPHSTIDGLKIEFANEWVHLRKSNTEPIIRIYAESKDEKTAHALAEKIIQEIKSLI
ncbi:MAG: phosphoglucosamine mutase [Bacteroidales bacterium]|nr:phosphoglucosamine mutase [Bacteroidales bacterium]